LRKGNASTPAERKIHRMRPTLTKLMPAIERVSAFSRGSSSQRPNPARRSPAKKTCGQR